MLYFIPWIVFLVGVILAVPIASWLEKRKHAPPPSKDPAPEELGDAEAAAGEDALEDSTGGDGFDQGDGFEGAAEPVSMEATDDGAFAEFDEDFK